MHDQPFNAYKMPRRRRCAFLAAVFVFGSSCLLAQGGTATSSSQAAQIQDLTAQVKSLQQQLATLTQRLTKDEAARGGGAASGPAGLSDADAKRLSALEARMSAEEAAQKNKKEPSDSVGTSVTAPFKVVDRNGVEILDVEDDAYRGLRVYAKNDSYTQVGGSDSTGYSNVGIHLPGDPSPRIAMGLLGNARPVFAIRNKNGILTTEVTEVSGGGQAAFANPAGEVVVLIGDNPKNAEGHANFFSAGGKPLAEIGAAGDHGDVLLGHEKGKEVWLWEMMLTGFH